MSGTFSGTLVSRYSDSCALDPLPVFSTSSGIFVLPGISEHQWQRDKMINHSNRKFTRYDQNPNETLYQIFLIMQAAFYIYPQEMPWSRFSPGIGSG